MLNFIFKTKESKLKEETQEYWEEIHDEEFKSQQKKYWEELKAFKEQKLTSKDILSIDNDDYLNVLLAENNKGWVWIDEAQYYISDVGDSYLSLKMKLLSTMTHWLNRDGRPSILPNYVEVENALEYLDIIKDKNTDYSIKPTENGFVIVKSEKEQYRCQTFNEAVLKIFLVYSLSE